MIQMNLLTNRNRLIEIENFWLTKGKGGGGGIN